MTKISEIPAEKFRLSFEKYCHHVDALQRAADGFAELPTPDARLISSSLNEVIVRFNQTWNLIRATGKRLRKTM